MLGRVFLRGPCMPLHGHVDEDVDRSDSIECDVCNLPTNDGSPSSQCENCLGPAHNSCLLKCTTSFTSELRYRCQKCTKEDLSDAPDSLFLNPTGIFMFKKPKENSPDPSIKVVEMLLSFGAQPIIYDLKREFPLHKAIKSNNISLVEYFLKNRIYEKEILNFTLTHDNYFTQPLLHYAALHGSVDIVKLLVRYGARTNSTDAIQQTPLFMAVLTGDVSKMQYLKRKGANLQAKTFSGRTLLHRAVWHGHLAAARWLLRNGLDPNCEDRYKWTPFHNAVAIGNVPMAAQLLEYGASVDKMSGGNKTPLKIAEDYSRSGMILFLKYVINHPHHLSQNTASKSIKANVFSNKRNHEV